MEATGDGQLISLKKGLTMVSTRLVHLAAYILAQAISAFILGISVGAAEASPLMLLGMVLGMTVASGIAYLLLEDSNPVRGLWLFSPYLLVQAIAAFILTCIMIGLTSSDQVISGVLAGMLISGSTAFFLLTSSGEEISNTLRLDS